MSLKNLIQEKTSDAQAMGKSPIQRRRIAFVLPTEDVCPGVFLRDGVEYDLKVIMEALSSGEEIQAISAVGQTPGAVVYEFVKRALWGAELLPRDATDAEVGALDVSRMSPDDKIWFWEAIESSGRQVLLDAFNEYLGSASTAALGKYRRGLLLL